MYIPVKHKMRGISMLHYNMLDIPVEWTDPKVTAASVSYSTQPKTSHMRLKQIKIEKAGKEFTCTVGLEENGRDHFYAELSKHLNFFKAMTSGPKEVSFMGEFSHFLCQKVDAKVVKAILQTVNAAVPFSDEQRQVLGDFAGVEIQKQKITTRTFDK
jgi:hypothetical protein